MTITRSTSFLCRPELKSGITPVGNMRKARLSDFVRVLHHTRLNLHLRNSNHNFQILKYDRLLDEHNKRCYTLILLVVLYSLRILY